MKELKLTAIQGMTKQTGAVARKQKPSSVWQEVIGFTICVQPKVYNAQTLCELLHISFRLEAKLKELAQSVTHNGMLRKQVMYGWWGTGRRLPDIRLQCINTEWWD